MTAVFADAVQEDRCPFCKHGAVNRSNSRDEYFSGSCPHCDGTGKPNAEVKRKAALEIEGLCPDCALTPADHGAQQWPYGCLRAAIAEIHRLRARGP